MPRMAALVPVSIRPPTASVESLVAALVATPAVVPAHEAEAEAGHAGPQPPEVPVVLEAAVEGEEQDEGDGPEGGADLHRADPVEVERLHWGDHVGAVADLVHHRLVVLGKHA